MKLKSTRMAIFIVLFAFLLVGYYFFLSHRIDRKPATEEDIRPSKIQDVLFLDMERNYPPSPKEVIKYYSEITQCFYNEEYTDQQLKELSDRAMALYDEELVANQGSSDFLLSALRDDIGVFKNGNVVISSYSVSAATDVDYFTQDGRDCAGLYCDYTMREGTSLRHTKQLYILRKDTQGHWKILGWERADT